MKTLFSKSELGKSRFAKTKMASLLLASSALVLTGCSDDDDPAPVSCSGTIAEIADCNSDFDTLFAAVGAANLGATLGGGEFTVFAPTDAAFAELLADLDVTAEEFLQRDDLDDILLYHVLAGSVDADAATTLAQSMDPTATTAETSTIELSLNDGDLFVNRSEVVTPNIEATNGIIHVIDKVLIPPDTFNVVETAQTDGRFDILVKAVVEAGLATTLATTNNLTVFAPTDDAFAALVASNDSFDDASDILALSNLGDILQYHVLDSEVNSTTAIGLAGNTTTPLNDSADLAISLSGSDLYINTSRVITEGPQTVNVDASNGIIHAIDKVLLPPTPDALSNTNQTIAQLVTTLANAQEGAEFTTLLAALVEAELDDNLGEAGPFTVFAPTDAAFATLLSDLGITAQQLLDRSDLEGILLDHVVNGNIDSISAYAANGTNVPSLRGNNLAVSIDMGTLMIEDANVLITDVETSNGVIHVIDSVIVKSAPVLLPR